MAVTSSKSPPPRQSSSQSADGKKVWLYLLLLTLQYGSQPLLSKRFTGFLSVAPSFLQTTQRCFWHNQVPVESGNFNVKLVPVQNLDEFVYVFENASLHNLTLRPAMGREVIVTSLVISCEVAKVICALFFLAKEGHLWKLLKEWTLVGSLTASALPAAIYALQNSLLQISYKNLDSLTFSMLNQTKLFFTALFSYIILGQKQSAQQIGALVLLIIGAVLLSTGESSGRGSSGSDMDLVLFYGIVPVLVASILSGLASALCQWASQVKKYTSYMMTVEMSIVGSICLLASMYKSPDGDAIKHYGFFHGWTLLTLIPVISNAVGGILVGLVTAYAGGVRKGFVIVSALLVTALLQFIFDGKPPSLYCLVALPLVVSSITIYQKYQYKAKKKEA